MWVFLYSYFVRFWWMNLRDRFSKNTHIWTFIKIRAVGIELFHTNGWADMTKPLGAFRYFADARNTWMQSPSQDDERQGTAYVLGRCDAHRPTRPSVAAHLSFPTIRGLATFLLLTTGRLRSTWVRTERHIWNRNGFLVLWPVFCWSDLRKLRYVCYLTNKVRYIFAI